MSLTIRTEESSDISAIDALTRRAFLGAQHTSGTEQFIVNALRRAGQLPVSLVAVDDGCIVGHVAVSPITLSDGGEGWYGLGPVSVAPERQGQGIGTRLVRQALVVLQSLKASGCVVLGEPKYYGRFGFKAESTLVLPGVPPEYFQALAFNGAVSHGTVAYHDAFNAQS